jgi:uncharacterized protein
MPSEKRLGHIIKIASRCNLNCSYCYVYNQADTSWKARPAVMSRETFEATVERIRRHVLLSRQQYVTLIFHGGEPTLAGTERFAWMCETAEERLGDVTQVVLQVQTNATRIDPAWVSVLRAHRVGVGVSLDGPQEVNDAARVDHRGRGSHEAVLRGIKALQEGGVPFGILSVVQPGADSVAIHRHFLELGCTAISYLLPSYTHDTIGDLREQFGPTPCADFLTPIFDDWWFNSTIEVSVREFWNMGRVIMGGRSQVDSLGNEVDVVCTETDGSIQGLDKLRSCEDGLSDMGLNVHEHDFAEIARASPFHGAVLEGLPPPTGCRACPERETCGGGHIPSRYSKARVFDNPSVWCADLLALFAHIRSRMGISHAETERRRAELERTAAGATAAQAV